ncbi:MAG TPA: TolC family protein [Kofleriaceae bacterium]|jgi:outer membrane protein TolC|nr:TolC family protein [Kofleriaceae bacterium]
MRVGLSVVFVAVMAAPLHAQPAGSAPPTAAQAIDELAEFDKELDAMFVAGGLTSDQAAARAGNVSPTVQRRIAEVAEQTAAATTTYLQGVPQIGGKLSYTRNSYIAPFSFASSGLMIPGVDLSSLAFNFLQNYYLAEATISIPVSDYLYRYPKLVGAAKIALEVAKTTRASAWVAAGQDARTAYYEWLRAKLQVIVAQRQVAQVQATLGQVRAQAEVQRISRADLLRVESQEAEAEQTAAQLTNIAELREEQLRVMLQVPDAQPLAIGEDIRKDVSAPAARQLDEMMGHVTAHRLDYLAIVQGIDARVKQNEAEVPNYLPKVSAFGVADYANPNQRIFPQEDKFTGTWAVGVQATWNLNDALTANVNRDRLQAQTDELRADQENFVRQTRIEVLQAQQNVLLAQHDLDTTAKGLKSAEESYHVRRDLLDAGRATAVELVDSETDLTRARINALNARIDLRVAIAQLQHWLGDDDAGAPPH